MPAQQFKDLMNSAFDKLFRQLKLDMPLIAPKLHGWAKDLGGTENPADYFLHPVAFPLMLLPWWLESQLREQCNTSFQEDLMISNASLYYYIRLVDNVMDGHATIEPKLLPAAGYFVDKFHSIYHSYFETDHPFWDFFSRTWGTFCDVTAADAQLSDVDEQTFNTLISRKVSAAKISVAAVCHLYDHAELIPQWDEWIDMFGCWHLFREDLFDWQQDLQLGAVTYLLSEARRKKRDKEVEASWMAREGLDWAMDQLKVRMERMYQMTFVSPEVTAYLQSREKEVIERRERLRPAFEFIHQLSESNRE